MNTAPFCLIRKFESGDDQAIKNIITEATMEQVGNFFWSALLSELLPQMAALFVAISYIVVGVPLKYCLIFIPLVIVLMYMSIWFGHWIKANELHSDLDNISNNYLRDPNTNFLVAEIYGKSGEAELASLMNKVKKVEYDFYDEKEFEVRSVNVNGLSKVVVGSIAITQSLKHPKRAWIRRMAVKKEYRRRKIASRLLTEAIKFCEKRQFEAIELITTECHSEAKTLYSNEGFRQIEVSHKSYLGVCGSQVLYHMFRDIKKTNNTTDKEQEASALENQSDRQKED